MNSADKNLIDELRTGRLKAYEAASGDIREHFGIMGLAKINYNACNYSENGLPVTVRLASKVGDVLTMGSAKDADRQPLKFYV